MSTIYYHNNNRVKDELTGHRAEMKRIQYSIRQKTKIINLIKLKP